MPLRFHFFPRNKAKHSPPTRAAAAASPLPAASNASSGQNTPLSPQATGDREQLPELTPEYGSAAMTPRTNLPIQLETMVSPRQHGYGKWAGMGWWNETGCGGVGGKERTAARRDRVGQRGQNRLGLGEFR